LDAGLVKECVEIGGAAQTQELGKRREVPSNEEGEVTKGNAGPRARGRTKRG